MKKKRLSMVALFSSFLMAFTFVGPAASASAPASAGGDSHEQQRIFESQTPNSSRLVIPNVKGSTDQEILQLLFAGVGPIAKKNPELLNKLGFDPNRPKINLNDLNQLIEDYLQFYPEFKVEVRDKVISGNPRKVEAGLVSLTESYIAFVEANYAEEVAQQNKLGESTRAAKGCSGAGAKVCVIAFAGAVVNGALYANVAVATMAVLAVAVIATAGVVVWYLEDSKNNSMGTRIERETMVANLAQELKYAL